MELNAALASAPDAPPAPPLVPPEIDQDLGLLLSLAQRPPILVVQTVRDYIAAINRALRAAHTNWERCEAELQIARTTVPMPAVVEELTAKLTGRDREVQELKALLASQERRLANETFTHKALTETLQEHIKDLEARAAQPKVHPAAKPAPSTKPAPARAISANGSLREGVLTVIRQLPEPFTLRTVRAALPIQLMERMGKSTLGVVLHDLKHLGVIEECGKDGSLILLRRSHEMEKAQAKRPLA
jgi:hypothetical protein